MDNELKPGEILKRKRKSLGMSRAAFANECGISQFCLQKIEDGNRKGYKDTWDKINSYLALKECYDNLIEDRIMKDMEKNGPNFEIYVKFDKGSDYGCFTVADYSADIEYDFKTTLGRLYRLIIKTAR